MSDDRPLEALVVGVGPGLGVALARRFGREAFAVTIVARTESRLARIAEELTAERIRIEIAAADAGNSERFRSAMRALAERITPSVVVYNAAVVAQDNVLTSDIQYLQNAYNVDALGAIIAAQTFTPAMRLAGRGTFLATGGHPGLVPEPAHATLSLGKAGLRTALRLMHDELKLDGVHATNVIVGGTIAPGTALDSVLIADAFWRLHTQQRDEWTAEALFDGS
jgi:short-subunit dehydrogenase